MSRTKRVAIVAFGGCAALFGSAEAGPERVAFPENYAQRFVQYATIDRANPKQIAVAYANETALAGAKKSGDLPSGSVLVMEVWTAKLDAQEKPILDADGRRIKDKLAMIAVMEKRTGWGTEYPPEIRNGEWEYAAFDPATKALRQQDYKPCFECHKPKAASDYLFTLDHLRRK